MMKKVLFFAAMAVFGLSANAQNSQMKAVLERMMPNIMRNQAVMSVNEVISDSILGKYSVREYEDGVEKLYVYYNNVAGTYDLSHIEYTRYMKGLVLEKGILSASGDTLERTLYDYAGNDLITRNYTYSTSGSELLEENHYYGYKPVSLGVISTLAESLGFNLMLCDSMKVITYEEGDTVVLPAVFTFNASGIPTAISFKLDLGGMSADIILDLSYTNNLPTSALVRIELMGGVIKVDALSGTVTYNAAGQPLALEILPLENPYFDVADFIGGKLKIENAYEADKLHSVSYYAWDEELETPAYSLESRDYYTYDADGGIDTVFTYYFFEKEAGLASATRLDVNVAPNPVQDLLHISGLNQSTQVSVYNAEGRLLSRTRVEGEDAVISLQEFSAGLYIVRMQNEEGSAVCKVVKR